MTMSLLHVSVWAYIFDKCKALLDYYWLTSVETWIFESELMLKWPEFLILSWKMWLFIYYFRCLMYVFIFFFNCCYPCLISTYLKIFLIPMNTDSQHWDHGLRGAPLLQSSGANVFSTLHPGDSGCFRHHLTWWRSSRDAIRFRSAAEQKLCWLPGC